MFQIWNSLVEILLYILIYIQFLTLGRMNKILIIYIIHTHIASRSKRTLPNMQAPIHIYWESEREMVGGEIRIYYCKRWFSVCACVCVYSVRECLYILRNMMFADCVDDMKSSCINKRIDHLLGSYTTQGPAIQRFAWEECRCLSEF